MSENTGEPTSETHPRAWAIFFQLDGDNSGTLEPAEVLAGLEKFGEEGLANLLMQKMDTDGDGKITFKEFVNGFDAIFENTPETAYALEEQGEIEDETERGGCGLEPGNLRVYGVLALVV